MSAIAIPQGAGWIVPSVTDRALGHDGGLVRSSFLKAVDSGDSVSLGVQRDAFHALAKACSRARVVNWDGEGARPVEASTIYHAIRFLRMLVLSVPMPDIYPEPDGELAFEWDEGPRAVFSVSVGRDGTLTFAGLFGHNKRHGTEVLEDFIPLDIAHGIRRALTSATR